MAPRSKTTTTATTAAAGANSGDRNVASELAYLTRVLKAPSLAASIERLAERARAESWTHEEFLAACLQREVAAREAHGGEGRIKAARSRPLVSREESRWKTSTTITNAPSNATSSPI